MTQIHNFDIETITDEQVKEFSKNSGVSMVDAKRMLIEILDEQFAPLKI